MTNENNDNPIEHRNNLNEVLHKMHVVEKGVIWLSEYEHLQDMGAGNWKYCNTLMKGCNHERK